MTWSNKSTIKWNCIKTKKNIGVSVKTNWDVDLAAKKIGKFGQKWNTIRTNRNTVHMKLKDKNTF